MAEAVIEERQLLKSLRWYDGFVIALCNPGFLIGSLGFTLDSIGVLGSLILWGASATIGLLQNWIYSESAAMFPDKPGGISLYAHEGWRRYFSLFGPIAAFGYWIGWSVVLSIFGNLIGNLVTAQWFPNAKFGGATHGSGYFSTGPVAIGLPQLIGVSAYGIEVCATFAPEYHDTKRDTALALRTAASFSLLVYVLLPLGLGGVTGSPDPTTATGAFYVTAFRHIVGGGLGGVALVLLIASLILSMNSATADGGRALYGIARDDMTIKQLYHLNRFHVPARAMTVDMVVNVGLILFVANNLAILYMSNIGYVFSHVLALSAFLLLRKDRPDWPRPIKVGPVWVALAAVFFALNLAFIIFGISQQKLAALLGGYTFSGYPLYLGIGVLVLSVLLFFYRRVVQDRKPITFRDLDAPTLPNAEQLALLQAEVGAP